MTSYFITITNQNGLRTFKLMAIYEDSPNLDLDLACLLSNFGMPHFTNSDMYVVGG